MRYVIWDKNTDVLTPSGQLFTPAEWQEYYPISRYVDIVLSGGEINGAYVEIYSQMKERWERAGLDFTGKTQEEVLQMIEDKENEESRPSDLNYQEEIMYALQDIAVNTMPDVEV